MNLIKSGVIPLHGAVVSMQGGRPENQDDWGFLDTPLGFLMIVCDGMGGGPGGKAASYIVKYEIAAALCECNAQTPREHALKMAVARANEALDRKMEEVPSLCGMGSTFVAVLINKQSAFVAHAGDSRCYRFHGKKCMYRSKDHSLVAELVKKKAFTEEEARLSPQSNVISRGLGSTSNHVPEIEEIPFSKGDRFVLCTDGVWGSMPHDELLKRFTRSTDLSTLVGNLSAEIDRIGFNKGGNHDNHTLVVFDMDTDSELKDKINWKKIIITAIVVCVVIILVTVIWAFVHNWKGHNSVSSNVITFGYTESPTSIEYTSQRSSDSLRTSEDSTGEVGETSSTSEAPDDESTAALINGVCNMKQKTDACESKDSMSISDCKDGSSLSSSEIAQNIIDKFNEALNTKEKEVKKAQEKMYECRKQINGFIELLRKQIENNDVNPKLDAIERQNKADSFWFVTKEANSEGFHTPTRESTKELGKQIERVQEVKKILEK